MPKPRGNPQFGSPKARRRLSRDLANKQNLRQVIDGLAGIAGKVPDAARSNPILGTVTGVVTLDILYRLRIISIAGYLAGLALVGVIDAGAVAASIGVSAGAVVGGVGTIFPSIGSKTITIASQESLIATSPNVSSGTEAKSAEVTVGTKGYIPE